MSGIQMDEEEEIITQIPYLHKVLGNPHEAFENKLSKVRPEDIFNLFIFIRKHGSIVDNKYHNCLIWKKTFWVEMQHAFNSGNTKHDSGAHYGKMDVFFELFLNVYQTYKLLSQVLIKPIKKESYYVHGPGLPPLYSGYLDQFVTKSEIKKWYDIYLDAKRQKTFGCLKEESKLPYESAIRLEYISTNKLEP